MGLLFRTVGFALLVPAGLTVCQGMELPAGPFAGLAAESFAEREKAQAELLEWGRKQPSGVKEELLKQTVTAGDPEVRERCMKILRQLSDEEFMRDGEGFLGISMRDETAVLPGDPNPQSMIRVTLVQEDSGAAKAGMLINDRILSLDGVKFPDGAASEPFRMKVRKMKPGKKIRVEVWREDKSLKLEITLGRRPVDADAIPLFNPQNPNLDQAVQRAAREAMERAAREAYFRGWLSQQKVP